MYSMEKVVPISAHEREAVELRVEVLKEQLRELLASHLTRQQVAEQWQTMLNELSDLHEKLGDS
jgi:hypothetical protein